MMTVQLSTPNNQRVFSISTAPQMPTVTLNATVAPLPAPGAQKTFRWTVQLRFAGSETAHGKPGTQLNVSRTTTEGRLVINPGDWGRLCGGTLSVSLSATVNGQTAAGQLQGLTIVGTNPTAADVRTALGSDPLRRIAHQESNYRQFGGDSWPLFSSDNLGGAGIMQITPATEDQRWNWRTNVQAGIDKYNHCYNLTATYVQSVRTSGQFSALVTALNQARTQQHLPAFTVTIPDWTADMRQRDAIRGYNGWAGSDPVVPNLHLHEYRLARDANGRLLVNQTPNTNRAEAIWEPVPASARPQGNRDGDPNYVAHVLAQTP